jgi:putative salt-induced outer membrane protein YdiY
MRRRAEQGPAPFPQVAAFRVRKRRTTVRTRVLGVFGLLCVFAAGTKADQVNLKNGDRISGEVVKSETLKAEEAKAAGLAGGDVKVLWIETEYAGLVRVRWDTVETMVTAKPLHLELRDGQTLAGVVRTVDGKYEVETVEAGGVSVAKGAIVAVRNNAEQKIYEEELNRLRHPRLSDSWGGLFDTGLNLTRGNSESLAYSLAMKAARITERDKITVYSNAIYAKSTTNGIVNTTAHAIRGGIRGDLNVSSRVFVFGLTDFEYDQFQDLDLRNVIGGGAGYHAIKSKNTVFDLFGGATYNQEFFGARPATATTPAIAAVTRKSTELLAGEELNAKVGARTNFTERFSLYPNLSEVGNYRFQFDASLATKLKNWLSWQATYSDRYLSNPLGGLKKNDLLVSTGLRLTFGKTAF